MLFSYITSQFIIPVCTADKHNGSGLCGDFRRPLFWPRSKRDTSCPKTGNLPET